MDLKTALKSLETIISKLEFLIGHQTFYLDEHEFVSKNRIDIQRETLINNINKISENFIDKIVLFNNDCKNNLQKVKKLDLEFFKSELIRFINEEKEFKNENTAKKLVENVKLTIMLAQNEIEKYENELKMNKKVEFEPINFVNDEDLFGLFSIKENKLNKPVDDIDFKCSKTLNDISNDINMSIELIEENRVAIGCKSGNIKLWNINSAQLIQTLSKDGHRSTITCMKWLNKSNFLVSCSLDGTNVWDLNLNQLFKTLNEHSNNIMSLCISEFYLISGSRDKTINVWNFNNFHHLHTLNEHSDSVNDIKCLNNILISCSSDKTIKIWYINDHLKCIKTLYGHLESVIHVSFIPDQSNLILSHSIDSMVKIWDIKKGECMKYFLVSSHPVYENAYVRLISNNILVTVHNFHRGKWTFSIWDLEKLICVKKFKEFKGVVNDVKYNGKLYLASWGFNEDDDFGYPITIWKIE